MTNNRCIFRDFHESSNRNVESSGSYDYAHFPGRGKRGQHKGQHRHFTNEEQLVADAEKAKKNREWRVILFCELIIS